MQLNGLFFGRVALPLASPGIIAATTLSFAGALDKFGATLMIAGNIPGQTQTILGQFILLNEKWQILKERSFPWYIHLEPLRLILWEE